MHDVVLCTPHQFGLDRLKSLGGRVLVTAGNRLFNLSQKRPNATCPRTIDGRAPLGLAKPFLR